MSDDYVTVGQIADRLGELPSRIAYTIAKYRLKSVARVGIIRLLSDKQVQVIRQKLYGMRIHATR